MSILHKYPRTLHLQGSGLQTGDHDLPMISFDALRGRHVVVEEKMDGANCAISFTGEGQLLLQSRGHYLQGGPRERQFDLLKVWANRFTRELWELLTARYVMYGEWLYAKHTVFYTELPHYLMEFDILDTATHTFLDTPRRQLLLEQAPFIVSVAVLQTGILTSDAQLRSLLGPSLFIGVDQIQQLQAACESQQIDPATATHETDLSGLMEGLYVKVEEDGIVRERYKFVRPGFLQRVFDSGSHWQDRPMLPNRLRPGAELF